MAGSLFWRQFWALSVKNWIVLLQHRYVNILRCFILPVGYGVFLAVAQLFLTKPNNDGIGSPIAIPSFLNEFDGSLALVWTDVTNGTGIPSPSDILAHITTGMSSRQLNAVKQVGSTTDLAFACPQNFNLFSECFAGISFNSMPTSSNDSIPLNYTIYADGGLGHVDVIRHKSDYELRILPLQWAIDSAIIELRTGQQLPVPQEWPFTQQTNKEQFTQIRLSYIRGLRTLLVLALFICYVGIAYQLPGSFMSERALLLTSHLQVMGLRNSARIISWLVSLSLVYLPAWVIVALIWHFRIFSATHVLIVLVIHLLFPLSLASWSLFVAAPFGKSPQLAAVASTFFSILFAILALVFKGASSGIAFIFTIIFPPGFYIFAIRCISGFEVHQIPTNALRPDPDNQLRLLPLLIAAIIDIFLWPYLTVLLERRLYDAKEPSQPSHFCCFGRRKAQTAIAPMSPGTAISVRNLSKLFHGPFSKKNAVTAIADLSFDIPKFGIFVLLGSNGAGKSTALSIIAGLLGRSSGSVTFEGGSRRPPPGVIGIVPQKNVLFPELTCSQTLRVWRAVKSSGTDANDDIEQLLRDCDLGHKIHANASTLSGGQKRKLQLAIGLIGGSRILLVDECTSGVDPLSRRALWKTLTSVRNDRGVVLTTHFLDEADLLADNIAILAAPGKLVAAGSPVSLKSSLGEGYNVHVKVAPHPSEDLPGRLLESIQTVTPTASISSIDDSSVTFRLDAKDTRSVARVLSLLEEQKGALGVASYDVHGTTLEDIFLQLMTQHGQGLQARPPQLLTEKVDTDDAVVSEEDQDTGMELTNGRKRSPFGQAFTIFHKRVLIARRSWLTPVLTVIVAVCGSCVPLFFLNGRVETCTKRLDFVAPQPLYLPLSFVGIPIGPPLPGSSLLISPPNATATLGPSAVNISTTNVPDNATLIGDINQNFMNLSLGGISLDLGTTNSLIAWEATPPGLNGPTLLNLADNILYNNALNASGKGSGAPNIIEANLQQFPGINSGTLFALKWTAFFGACMGAFPAFYALYVSQERRSSVQAMQLSNGLSDPIGLWLGHLMFDSVFTVILSTIIAVIFATTTNQFHGVGLLWLILVLFGVAETLFAYCVSLFATSPLAAFAIVAGSQVLMFILYTAGYLLTLTYAKTSRASSIITIIHFTVSLVSPIGSVLRASFVSVNLFSLLCDGNNSTVTTSSLSVMTRYGGPIVYLIAWSILLFVVLVWVDSGSKLPRKLPSKLQSAVGEKRNQDDDEIPADVLTEAELVERSEDPLRVLHVSKTFTGSAVKAVEDVSFGVSQGTVLALLGPNGAGKTTAFNVIRNELYPDSGDVLIQSTSVIRHPRTARLSLGVCPQFTAIDSQMTVREHLMIYGRLKGLYRGEELRSNIETLMASTALSQYADRLASKLSGGNQRKLSLAIALIGNPSVILIDEFSTGIDAKMKRDMWQTLKNVAVGKAVVITTHSMEEASALANKVGIIARKMLAVGSTDALAARYPIYEIHFSCRNRDEVTKAQQLMARIPGSRMADDVATRFEVPLVVEGEKGRSLADLFQILAEHGDFTEYTVERVSLESVFLKVIRENNIKEEDRPVARKRRWRAC